MGQLVLVGDRGFACHGTSRVLGLVVMVENGSDLVFFFFFFFNYYLGLWVWIWQWWMLMVVVVVAVVADGLGFGFGIWILFGCFEFWYGFWVLFEFGFDSQRWVVLG